MHSWAEHLLKRELQALKKLGTKTLSMDQIEYSQMVDWQQLQKYMT